MYPCKLLIIDDDRDDVELLTDALLQAGFSGFHCVSSAQEALNFLDECVTEEALPRLIVTDLYLPGVNGLQLVMNLTQTERYKNISIFVLSNLKFELVSDYHKNLAATGYIKKPTTYQDYLKVAAYLSHKSAA